eukprot:GSA25T00008387001.1
MGPLLTGGFMLRDRAMPMRPRSSVRVRQLRAPAASSDEGGSDGDHDGSLRTKEDDLDVDGEQVQDPAIDTHDYETRNEQGTAMYRLQRKQSQRGQDEKTAGGGQEDIKKEESAGSG